ncbi:hypothetical protein KQI49_02475 [Virgibacillus sp. MSJ-26]|uniref:hypothetical protein n=1 Tax=Virgibacillus sp. MSJ-26 TaxID=2841522 RepID=UPI001C0FA7B4|nr:hypothetical protein [Virgibacillus sp. MSJ-26]MBU5465692.1 hypothetical protein [Virgibacillus sp. MSJ-26]
MKRFILFLSSFIFLFVVFQMLSGLILTSLYLPNIEEAWEMSAELSSEVTMVGTSSIPTIIGAVLAATIAYFVPKGIGMLKHS